MPLASLQAAIPSGDRLLIDTTVLGAALLAGVGVGIWKGVDDIKRVWVTDRDFKPSMSDGKVREYVGRWEKAIARA